MSTALRWSIAFASLGVVGAVDAAPPKVIPARHKVRIERAVMIPMRDGKRLSADLIRPDSEGRFPVVMMYQPYRKDDVGRGGVGPHQYFAERGFVAVRLDARGTGTSEGVNTDEYTLQEQQDGYDAVEWLARQSWSNGNIGIWGISYSGFTALQVATHQPPHLKAIVPIYATDDRYTDDCHYDRGGNMRMYYDVGHYGGWMVAMNALPPMPELAGPRWAEMWTEHLQNNEPYLLKWMKQQTDGPYWRNGSLRPGYERIKCPTFLIAGWRDGYPNAMVRTYMNLKVPRKLLVGPWVHSLPNSSVPGPRIDWMNEAGRFFAHWLRDEDTGIMSEPPVTVYMQEYSVPDRTLDVTPGSWRNEADFPASGTSEITFYIDEGGKLASTPAAAPRRDHDEFEYVPTVGLSNGYWSGGGIPFYLPDDQRADEAYSLVYTTEPIDQEIRILGWPKVILHASSSARVATFVAKLTDVAPDDHSALIVDGALNGTRRQSLTTPSAMTPGEVYELAIPMLPTGWMLKLGHRLRLAVSSSDFPDLWPTPEPARNRVFRGGRHSSRVVLPVVPESKLPAPEFLPPPALRQIVSGSGSPPVMHVLYDQVAGTATVLGHRKGATILDEGLGTVLSDSEFRCTASSRDPGSASIIGTHKIAFQREDGLIEVTGESSIRATKTHFHILVNLTVTRNGMPFFQKQWVSTEARNLL